MLTIIKTENAKHPRLNGMSMEEYSKAFPYSIESGITHLYGMRTEEQAKVVLNSLLKGETADREGMGGQL